MKRSIYSIILGALVLSFLTGCTDINQVTDVTVADEQTEAEESMDEVEASITLEDILKANSSENIFANYAAVTLKEHDYANNKDTEDYFSEKINYRSGPDYYSLMSEELVATNDPEGPGYGCVVDNENFEDVFASYMRIDWTNYDEGNVTIDGNTLTIECECEDYIITFDQDSLLFLIKEAKNKDGSDWLRTEYEYSKQDRDEDIIATVKEDISKISEDETVSLLIEADGEESQFTVPKGFSAIIYSDDYYYYQGTEEVYFNQLLDEDTVLTKIVEDGSEEIVSNTEE